MVGHKGPIGLQVVVGFAATRQQLSGDIHLLIDLRRNLDTQAAVIGKTDVIGNLAVLCDLTATRRHLRATVSGTGC